MWHFINRKGLGPDIQNIVSLMSLLMANLLTVVAMVFSKYTDNFAAKIWVAFALQKLLTFFFQQKISMYLPYFKIETLTLSVLGKNETGL